MSEEIQKITNSVKLVGETLLPGASLLMDGDIKKGAAHTIVGLVARSLLGPVGWGLVAANSFAKSVSDKSIIDYASDIARDTFKREKKATDTEIVPNEAAEQVTTSAVSS